MIVTRPLLGLTAVRSRRSLQEHDNICDDVCFEVSVLWFQIGSCWQDNRASSAEIRRLVGDSLLRRRSVTRDR